MTEQNQSPDEKKDGFDLIEYPCEYRFKAMCRVADGENLEKKLIDIVNTKVDKNALIKVSSTASRTGKFESFTLTVKINDREQLESIYHAIASSPFVVMTL